METTYTYVVANHLTNRIKIGRTTNLKQRLESIALTSGCKLELVFIYAIDIEQKLHKQFRHLRDLGEWFIDNGEIRTFCNVVEPSNVVFGKSKNIDKLHELDLNQNYLWSSYEDEHTIDSDKLFIEAGDISEFERSDKPEVGLKFYKRLFSSRPTLVWCKYNHKRFALSNAKWTRYRLKLSLCLLLVSKFYFDAIDEPQFNYNVYRKLPLSFMYGVMGNGFKTEAVSVQSCSNDGQIQKTKNLRRPSNYTYREEVTFLTDKFLILHRRSTLQFGPTLWKFRQLDLGDATLIEIKRLVEVYRDQLDYLNFKFEESIEAESVVLDNIHLEQNDIDLIIDIVQLWVGDARG